MIILEWLISTIIGTSIGLLVLAATIPIFDLFFDIKDKKQRKKIEKLMTDWVKWDRETIKKLKELKWNQTHSNKKIQ